MLFRSGRRGRSILGKALLLVSSLLLVFCGLNTVLAYGAFSEALDHLEASRVSAVLATIPIIAIVCIKLLTAIFPGFIETEKLNLISIAGAFLVVTGSMISSLSGKG